MDTNRWFRRDELSRALKEQLPAPYNRDLSVVLRGLKRPDKANDPLTAAYLYAGVRLLIRNLGPAGDATRPLQSFLSQRAVASRVNRNPPPFPSRGAVATLRDHWEPHANFIADVFRFVLWGWHYPAPKAPEMTDVTTEILHGEDPVAAIHEMCYWDMTRHLATPMFRLSLIAAAEAETAPAIHEAVAERNLENSTRWREFYAEFLKIRGLRLRPDVTLDDCVSLLSAAADGLALRALTENSQPGLPNGTGYPGPGSLPGPGSPVMDHRSRRCLLGHAVLAVIAGCTEPDDHCDGQSLDQAAASILTR